MFDLTSCRYASTLIALGTVLVGAAGAQESSRSDSPRREGFWLSAGAGYGSLGCETCGDRQGSISGGLSLGGTINPRLLLGVGTTGWTKSEDGVTLSVGTLDARARFYPAARGRFFLTGGLGLGTVSAKVDGFGADSETGVGVVLGFGIDVPISRNASITPYLNVVGVNVNDSNANFSQIGLAITFH